MKRILNIAALTALFMVVSLSGFSQRTCALRVNDTVSGATYYATAYLINVTTNPIGILETSPYTQVYKNQTNNIPFSYTLPPSQNNIWMYHVVVTRTSPFRVEVGNSQLFNTNKYNSDNIPVDVNF